MTPEDLRFWTRGSLANGIGELVGLGIVFGAGFFNIRLAGVPQTPGAVIVLAIVAIGLGVVEGTVVGYAQSPNHFFRIAA